MKRIAIIVEGDSEAEFVKELIMPYLWRQGIYDSILPVMIQTSKGHRGGFANYEHLKNDVRRLLSSKDQNLRVTTMVDFFRCPKNFPGMDEAKKLNSHLDQVELLEKHFFEEINDSRFFPYIQLHEFEALLFSSNRGFERYLNKKESEKTKLIVEQYDNPEMINTTPQGAPSKRLLAISPSYDKVLQGNLCALEVGIDRMLEKCPRFRNWVERIRKGI